MPHDLEICIACDSEEQAVANALAAAAGGANRLECCASMDVGGLTPKANVIRAVCQAVPDSVDVLVMIRPRAGDFSWTANELDGMEAAITEMASCGVQGVVGGAVTDGQVDVLTSQRLIQSAIGHQLSFTFHRAIDAVVDRIQATKTVIDLGADRILTAGTPWGTEAGAVSGLPALVDLEQSISDTAEIVIGGGVSLTTLPNLLEPFQDSLYVSFHAFSSVLSDGFTDQQKVGSLKKLLS